MLGGKPPPRPKGGTQPMEETMGLKLILEPGDKILMGDDTIISVLTTGSVHRYRSTHRRMSNSGT